MLLKQNIAQSSRKKLPNTKTINEKDSCPRLSIKFLIGNHICLKTKTNQLIIVRENYFKSRILISVKLTVSITLIIVLAKYLSPPTLSPHKKKSLRKEPFILAHSSRAKSIRAGQTWLWE